ncbi:MAG: ABC-2 family transporter protein [Patescibacteria group bacterium]
MDTIKEIYNFLKTSFRMDLKRSFAYPISFWFTFITIPFYSVVQIAFVESIFGNTNSFAGYSKYEAYVLFGTFRLIQGLGFFFFYNRLTDLKYLIRGEGEETFDSVLLKPIDSQLNGTVGRYNLGNISSVIVGLGIVVYAVTKGNLEVHLINVLFYFCVVLMGILFMYISFLIVNTFLFWFDLTESMEGLWESTQAFGQYPPSLYHGATGIILNIIIPVTLMAGVPSNILLGKVSILTFFVYLLIISVLFYLSRLFWNYAVRRYSSSSS